MSVSDEDDVEVPGPFTVLPAPVPGATVMIEAWFYAP